jgi:adenosylcobinamide-GDP ribazoletransferase
MRLGELAHGLRFAIGTLSAVPVRVERVDREVAGQAMTLAPAVGLALGAVAGLPLLLLPGSPLLGSALALGLLAMLTRGLHLDGLADLADGLGSGKPAADALDIMKKSDIGPFGVMTLVFTLLVQAAALSVTGLPALVTACVTGRLALTWACRANVPAARPGGLGAMVAGTVRNSAAWLATLAALALTAALGLASDALAPPRGPDLTGALAVNSGPSLASVVNSGPDPATALAVNSGLDLAVGAGPGLADVLVLPLALVAGLGVALLVLRHAVRRLGGITGDVLGALVETATAAALVVCAVLG